MEEVMSRICMQVLVWKMQILLFRALPLEVAILSCYNLEDSTCVTHLYELHFFSIIYTYVLSCIAVNFMQSTSFKCRYMSTNPIS